MIRHIAWLFIFIASITGCAQQPVTDSHKSIVTMVVSGDFSPHNNGVMLGWHPSLHTIHSANKLDDAELERHMRLSLTQILTSKGYRFAQGSETPTVLVGFAMALESEMSDNEILAKAGLVPGLSTEGMDDKYEKGSVFVAMFTHDATQPRWRVLAQGFTEPKTSIDEREQRFDKLAALMLNQFPAAN